MIPDDDACLEWLWRRRFAPDGHTARCPRCQRERRFHRVRCRQSFSCDTCGLHLHPTVDTIFERSSTGLGRWFRAAALINKSDGTVTARQLQGELGVTYKTAWRMRRLILAASTGKTPGGHRDP